MLCFVNDYSQGAHEQILKRLSDINREPQTAYRSEERRVGKECGS